jgi:dipeptidyl-peptidase 4
MQKVLVLVCLLIVSQLTAQKKEFLLEDLVKGKLPQGFYNSLPTVGNWLNDDELLITTKLPGDEANKPYVLNVLTNKYRPATEAEIKKAPAEVGIINKNNDLFYKDKQLTNDKEKELNPTLSPDNNFVAYTKGNNLYSYNLKEGKETQITFDGSDIILNGYASWVYWEEIFGRPTAFRAFWWSPDSKQIAYMRFDQGMVPMFPIYINDGKHGSIEETRYPKVGDKNPEVKLGFVAVTGGKTTWANFNEKTDQYFGWPKWTPNSQSLVTPWMPRSQDSLVLYYVNPSTGSAQAFYTEAQKTWIQLDDDAGERIQFINDGKEFILFSDKTGWRHIYLYDASGKLKNPITQGDFTVNSIELVDEKNKTIFFKARKENSARYDMYKVRFDGKKLERVTFGDYNHVVTKLSPTGKHAVSTYQNASNPTSIAVIGKKGAVIPLGTVQSDVMKNYNLAKTELIRIPSDDGLYQLPALVTWPTNMADGKPKALLISIYGGPDAGTVYDNFSFSPTGQLYAQEGLIQVAFDHRASGHFGKKGVNYMYRSLGIWEMIDYATMVNWFIKKGYVDSNRVAITGFSYGGYLSCLAVTKHSNVFKYAMAGGSVTDWQLYDSHYTERFMDTREENPDGYKNGSPVNYVADYKGGLQMVHGSSDDNVHLQNSMQLAAALQNAKKEFEFMVYPGGRHGWRGNSWTHYTNSKIQFIYKNLLQKPVPAGLLK